MKMKRLKTAIAIFFILVSISVFSVVKAESFDPEVVSQVSKAIAEGKLLNEDKEQTQSEQTVYVSSSLSGMVEKDGGERVGIIKGLAAFDNDDYWIKSEIRNWELNTGVMASNRYICRLPTNPWPNVLTSMGSKLTIRGMGSIYSSMGQTYNEIANVFRAQQGLGPTNVALQNTARGLRIYNISTTIMGASLQTVDTFQKTVHYVGTSMQVMNPPIYLNEKTSWGWRGEGSYPIQSGRVHYQETLKTAGPGPITRTHTDGATTNIGTYIRHVQITTPPASSFERFMMYHYPVGGYFDPDKTTIITMTRSQQSYRIETVGGGIPKVTPLPNSGIGSNWNSPPPTFNATWKTVEIGSTIYKYPSIDWTSIPKTNWTIPNANPLPTYKPSIPKMPTYTPTMPSSSWGRKY